MQPFPFMSSYCTSRSRVLSPSSAHQDRFLDDDKRPKLASPGIIQTCRRCSKDGPEDASSHLSRRSCYFRPPAVARPLVHLLPARMDRNPSAKFGTCQEPVQSSRRATRSAPSPQSISLGQLYHDRDTNMDLPVVRPRVEILSSSRLNRTKVAPNESP